MIFYWRLHLWLLCWNVLCFVYASSHKHINLNFKVLNLISSLAIYVPRESSFISTQFFVLNFDDWFAVFSNKLVIFYILLFYYIESQITHNFLGFFQKVYILWYFYFTFSCFWKVLWWSFWDFWFYQRFYYQSSNQFLQQFFFFFFWIAFFRSSFECTCTRMLCLIKTFLAVFATYKCFCSYFCLNIKLNNLLLDLCVKQNNKSFLYVLL